MVFVAAPDRYTDRIYRRSGRSGLKLPAISLGLWQNFGADRRLGASRTYLAGVPRDSRASRGGTLRAERLSPQMLEKARSLADLASRRGQTLAQMALAWVLRDPRMTSALIGASSVAQLEENLGALADVVLPPEDPTEIEQILASTPAVQPMEQPTLEQIAVHVNGGDGRG